MSIRMAREIVLSMAGDAIDEADQAIKEMRLDEHYYLRGKAQGLMDAVKELDLFNA